MGMELFSRWPEILRRQDRENLLLRAQFQPELFWNGAPAVRTNEDHRAVIFGQVAIGCAVSDLVQSFAVHPAAVIGYLAVVRPRLVVCAAVRATSEQSAMSAGFSCDFRSTNDSSSSYMACMQAARISSVVALRTHAAQS